MLRNRRVWWIVVATIVLTGAVSAAVYNSGDRWGVPETWAGPWDPNDPWGERR